MGVEKGGNQQSLSRKSATEGHLAESCSLALRSRVCGEHEEAGEVVLLLLSVTAKRGPCRQCKIPQQPCPFHAQRQSGSRIRELNGSKDQREPEVKGGIGRATASEGRGQGTDNVPG